MSSNVQGRITYVTLALIGGLIVLGLFNPFTIFNYGVSETSADTATTTVTVLNTAPQWSTNAQESPESSTSTPTNVGSNASWTGTASDSNNDSYYLLICKTSSTPTANSGSAPTCNGGASNQWAVSSFTSSSAQATASYTALAGDAENNTWVAWICDANASNPSCNSEFQQGSGSTASPFVVNHRPNFTSVANDGPKDPGAFVTWTSVASDTDAFGGNDTIALHVCKANDFSGASCGAGGAYCSSTLSGTNPSCSSTVSTPSQDKNYPAFAFLIDNHNFAASGGAQATSTAYNVNNVAPSIQSSSISLLNTSGTGDLILTVPQGQTTGFRVTFTARDNNSCLNASSGNEVASATINVYRSGVGQGSCQTGGQYNANSCYPAAVGTSTWSFSCSQDGGSCAGSSSITATWTCTFPLWFLADATDGTNASDSQYFAQNWLPSVRITDDNSTSSALTEASTGNEIASYLAYTLNTRSIAFGGLSPGQQNTFLTATTTVTTQGNVGLDTTLYGTDMCTTYPTCPTSTTSTISVGQLKYATSSVGYGSSTATALLVNPGALLGIHVSKSTSTVTSSTGTTFWGIAIPSSITLAGDYTGQNTVIGQKSPAQTW